MGAHIWLWLRRRMAGPTLSPPPTIHHLHPWLDQKALDLRLMEPQRLFEMLFCNAMRTQQTARVASMQRAQIFKVPVDQNYPTFGYRSGKPNRWPDPILPQANRPQTPDQNHCHDPRAPDKMELKIGFCLFWNVPTQVRRREIAKIQEVAAPCLGWTTSWTHSYKWPQQTWIGWSVDQSVSDHFSIVNLQ